MLVERMDISPKTAPKEAVTFATTAIRRGTSPRTAQKPRLSPATIVVKRATCSATALRVKAGSTRPATPVVNLVILLVIAPGAAPMTSATGVARVVTSHVIVMRVRRSATPVEKLAIMLVTAASLRTPAIRANRLAISPGIAPMSLKMTRLTTKEEQSPTGSKAR